MLIYHLTFKYMKEDKELIKEYREGNPKALDELFENNKILVMSVYEKLFRQSGCPKEDLCQEGYLGLLEAVNRFKEDKSAGFNGYKRLWIRKKMYDFRREFFKRPTVELNQEHLNIKVEPTRSENLRYALFELDNMVASGKMPKTKAKDFLRKLMK